MITITRQNLSCALRAALEWVCEDETRFHLCTVYLEVSGDHLHVVATNGHGLCDARPECKSTADASVLIPVDRVKDLLRWLKCKKAENNFEITLTIAEDKLHASGMHGVCEVVGMREQFPPFRQVIPERSNNSCNVVGVSPDYLELAGRSGQLFYDDPGNSRGFEWSQPAEPLAPIRLDMSVPDRGDLTVVIMPMRI
jgi:hypothetical protein